jgi:hypothetical protein
MPGSLEPRAGTAGNQARLSASGADVLASSAIYPIVLRATSACWFHHRRFVDLIRQPQAAQKQTRWQAASKT